jgi:hypothetical protein
LEDLIQYVALKHFESNGKKSWKFSCCDYIRENGLNINSYSKVGAKTLEQSFSIDAPSKHEESDNSYYLLDQESILRSVQDEKIINQDDYLKGTLEEFLLPLNLANEVVIWTLKNYKVSTNLK